jgi:hypothetical protein
MHANHWFVTGSSLALERPKLDVCLHNWVSEFASDQTLGIENGVLGIPRHLILGGITDETF